MKRKINIKKLLMCILKYIKNIFQQKYIVIDIDTNTIIKDDDFIKGHWYKFQTSNMNLIVYFIFGERKYGNIHVDNDYIIVYRDDKFILRYIGLNSTIVINGEKHHYQEVRYQEIVEAIPDTCPTKISYLRNKKIKSLLNIK